jgi:hypothetical protein
MGSRLRVFGFIGIGLLFVWALGRWAGLLLGLTFLTVAYFASLRIHPRIRHNGPLGIGWFTCRGTGEKHSHLFPWIWHRDKYCRGSGRVVRWGARRWGSQSVKAEAVAAKQGRRTAKQNRTWR